MDKQLNRDQFQAILDSRPKGVPLQTAINMYVKNGWIIEGINEPAPTVTEQIGTNLKERGEKVLNTAGRSDVTFGEKVLRNAGNAVATIGDVAAPVIGAGLKATGLDKPLGQAVEAITQTAPAQAIGEAYGNLSERTQENLGAVGNVASAIPVAKAGQVAVQGVKTGAKATITAGSELLAKRAATKAVNEAKQIDNLAGTIVQGTPQDIAKAKKAIASIDVEGVKTYKDLVGAFDEKIKNLSRGLDEVLATKPEPKLLDDLTVTANVGDGTVTHNYVKDALIQLEDLYTKTNNVVAREQIGQLVQKASGEGLTIKEVNDLARLHGKELNAFNANGQAASGLTKQAAENTRTGLKATARDLFNDPLYKEADTEISTLIRTRDLVDNVAVKVNQLQQRIQERGLGAKVGVALGRVINTLGLGTPKGIVEALIPRGQGFKVMNALDLEKALSGNLKKLQEAIGGKTETDVLNKLNNLLQESKVNLMTKSTATMNKNVPIKTDTTTTKKKVNSAPVDSLLEEAKKYKSAEEFVRAQGESWYHGGKLDGGVDMAKTKRSLYGKGFNLTNSAERAGKYNDNINEFVVNPNKVVTMRSSMAEDFFNKFADKYDETPAYKNIISRDSFTYQDAYEVIKRVDGDDAATQFFANNGVDGWRVSSPSGLSDNTSQLVIFNPKVIKTKQQLTDLYNQAKGKK